VSEKPKTKFPENKYPLTMQYLKELHIKRGGGKAVLVAGNDFRDLMDIARYESRQHKKALIKHLKETAEKE